GAKRSTRSRCARGRARNGAPVDKLRIRGVVSLEGELRISGAKNAARPIMCAALLTGEPLRLANVPQLMDVRTMAKLLGQMGVAAEPPSAGRMVLHAALITEPSAGYALLQTLRSAWLVL